MEKNDGFQQQDGKMTARFAPLRDYVAKLIDRGVPGCELMVCRDHEILFHVCAGYSDAKRQRPASPSDQYLMYSCTKPVTATAAMQCVERGLFGLDDPVEKYLPCCEKAHLMKNGEPTPVRRKMTIRHLMTMTAGFNYNLRCEPVQRLLAAVKDPTTRQIADALLEAPLDFEPGERFQYSLCHDVLAAVIEVVSGMTFAEYVQKNIFDPLHMVNSGFWTRGCRYENLAALYCYDETADRAVLRENVNDMIPSANYYSGGAGMVSCAEDYLRFADALACGESSDGARILGREAVDLMRSEQIATFRVSGNFTCTCGDDYGYGLGVRTRVAFNHGVPSAKGEFGWDGAAGADLLVDPEHRLSAVYVQHVLNWPAMLGTVHLQIRDLLYPILGL